MSRFVLSIVGAGHYGTALAYLASWHSKSMVKLIDTSEEKLSQSSMLLEQWLNSDEKMIGPPEDEIYDIYGRITVSPHLDDIEYSDFVVESITENLEQKNEVIKQIEKIVDQNIVIASTTSHIPITKIAKNTQFPNRILGLNYSYLPWISNSCEIVASIKSSNEAIATARNYTKKMGLKPSICMDWPGFISKKPILVLLNEAIWMLHGGIAQKEDVDTSLTGVMALRFGILEYADFIGLDEILDGLRMLHKETGDDKYKPCPLLVNLVNSGMLGRKTCQGFYQYDPNESPLTYRTESINKSVKEYNIFLNVKRDTMQKFESLYEDANLDYLEKFEYEELRETNLGDPKAFVFDDLDEYAAERIDKIKQLYEKIRKQNPQNKPKESEHDKAENLKTEKIHKKVKNAIKNADNKVEELKAEFDKLKKHDMLKHLRDPNNSDESLTEWLGKFKEIYQIKGLNREEKDMIEEFVWDFTRNDSKLEEEDFDKLINERMNKKFKEEGMVMKRKKVKEKDPYEIAKKEKERLEKLEEEEKEENEDELDQYCFPSEEGESFDFSKEESKEEEVKENKKPTIEKKENISTKKRKVSPLKASKKQSEGIDTEQEIRKENFKNYKKVLKSIKDKNIGKSLENMELTRADADEESN